MSFAELDLRAKRVLYVASTGGHLSELARLHAMVDVDPNSALITFATAQSSSINWVDDVRFVPYVKPRDALGTLRTSRTFRRYLTAEPWDAVVSTGAAIAVAALPVAAALDIRAIYVESYARFTGPSTTGRILSRLPGRYELYTQHPSWASGPWRYAGSVIDALVQGDRDAVRGRDRFFITLGTISPYRFDALVDSVLKILPARAKVVWQVGCTERRNLPGTVYTQLERTQFAAEARRAEVVISHAGVGSAIELIEMGHRPILIPRRAYRDEHVDDHQLEIADDFARRGLAITCDARDINESVLLKAAAA